MTNSSHCAGLDFVPLDDYRAQLHPPGMVLRGEAFITLRTRIGKLLTTAEVAMIREHPHCVVVTSGDEWDLDDLSWLDDEL